MKLISTGREPFEVWALSAISLYGVAASISFDRFAVTTLRNFPAPAGQVFIGLFGLGALVALTGVLMGNVTGVLIERTGLWLVAGLGAAFAAWSAGTNGSRALAFVLLVLGVAIASGVRLRNIHRQQRRSTAAAKLATDEREGG